jgi:hypothetical protein
MYYQFLIDNYVIHHKHLNIMNHVKMTIVTQKMNLAICIHPLTYVRVSKLYT